MIKVFNLNNYIIIVSILSLLFFVLGCSNSSNITLNRETAILGFEGSSTQLVQNAMSFSKDTMIYKIKYLTDFSDYDEADYQKTACSHLDDILHKEYKSSKAELRTKFKVTELKVNVVRLELTTVSGKKYICVERIGVGAK